ncbi:4-coumarate--CoA ligase-like 7 [Pleurostoma richardsiae]|uniref:4-coumarate--CoA ligase-like 7 n=1 Tax=Pleurostoma richardsiae TaxID=41990 RepID=A0AA38RSF6_9PEZI|nr:4-coumarate--CoA ligase-like 7 [Pleurostoma richardsiae]
MTINSRWEIPIPRCSLQQWVFDSSRGPLPDRKVFIDADRPETHYLTLEDHRLLSKRIALGLQDAGLRNGDRVLLYSGNNVYFPSIFLGILMAGGVFTGANPGFTARELAYQLQDSAASFMLAAEGSLDTALDAAQEVGLPRQRVYIFDSTSNPRGDEPLPGHQGERNGSKHWTQLLSGNRPRAAQWDWLEPADPDNTTCCLNYSSGTTGVPKGVEISHRSYVANGTQVVHVGGDNPEVIALRARAKGLCFLPMYHAYAQTYFVANFTRMGIPVFVMPQFNFEKMLQHIQRFKITSLTCVPPIVVALAKHPLTKRYDLSSIESLGCGAAPLAAEVGTEVEKLFPERDVIVRQGWGMTEVTCTCMSWDPTPSHLPEARSSGGVGELMPNCSARIMELDGETEILESNKPGELWVTGPTLMRGYWRKPKATQETTSVDTDGTRWLKTGDIAYVEDYGPGAIFHIVDRLKELIKVKGHQVAPAELEAVLLERPDVADVAVVGVTIKGQELPRAYIVRVAGAAASEREISKWIEGKVARYKQLRGGVSFIDCIPKNPSGKILRKLLRERAQQEVGDRRPPESRLA